MYHWWKKDNEQRRKENSSNVSTREENVFPGLKTDKLTFDKYNGDVRHYQTWKTNFEQLMGPNFKNANKAQKTLLLKNNLSDKIKDEVLNYIEIEEIWDYLDSKYGNTRKFVL